MASRPVFVAREKLPYVMVYSPEFTWNSGLSKSQQQKNIVALHGAHGNRFPNHKLLEISSKSTEPLGNALSAFHLQKYVPAIGRSVPLECVYQGGKVFAAGGPYTDLYEEAPKDAKRDPRFEKSGMLRSFFFDGEEYPLTPKTAFYDWLYILALKENPELGEALMAYDGFTDIVYNPNKSVGCQARSAALYVGLTRAGLLNGVPTFTDIAKLKY
ncbi:MAG: hypothetical protein IKM13_00745 [Clostridia bacterium]|nr:hypothetical protein [Clostridia bacterium]